MSTRTLRANASAARLDPVVSALEGADVVQPRRQTFYGMDEIFVRAPCGTVVGFAARLEQGAEGAAIKELQQALMDVGVFVPGGADGVYGSATTTAVRQFQRWNGLDAMCKAHVVDWQELGFDFLAEPKRGDNPNCCLNSRLSG